MTRPPVPEERAFTAGSPKGPAGRIGSHKPTPAVGQISQKKTAKDKTETEPKSRWPNSSRGSGSTCKEKGVANSAVIRLDRSRKPGQRIRQEDRGEPQDAYQEGTSNETYGPHGNSTDDQAARLREGRETHDRREPRKPLNNGNDGGLAETGCVNAKAVAPSGGRVRWMGYAQ